MFTASIATKQCSEGSALFEDVRRDKRPWSNAVRCRRRPVESPRRGVARRCCVVPPARTGSKHNMPDRRSAVAWRNGRSRSPFGLIAEEPKDAGSQRSTGTCLAARRAEITVTLEQRGTVEVPSEAFIVGRGLSAVVDLVDYIRAGDVLDGCRGGDVVHRVQDRRASRA